MNNNNSTALLLFFVGIFTSVKLFAVTVDAGDYTRLPEGTNLLVLYSQYSGGESLYVDGDKVSDNAELDVQLNIFRAVRFYDVGNITIAPQFLLPFGKVETGGDLASLDSENGVGDLIINPTIHLYKDPTRKKAFAFTPWLFLPTGDYDREKDINVFGENRYRFALQLGYITPISSKWTLDVLGDVMFFGENDDFTSSSLSLKQDPLYELQTHLRYNFTPTTFIAGLVSQSWGGETKIEGVEQDNEQNRAKYLLTLSHFISPRWQMLASFGQDISVDEGVEEDLRFNLRLLKIF